MNDDTLAQIASLKTMPPEQLKKLWSSLYQTEPPGFNREYLVSRLTYRIQELAWGGDIDQLKQRMTERAKAVLGDNLRHKRNEYLCRPPTGTRLVRDYKGTEYTVTVLEDGFAFEGRKYRSLSRIAHLITGTPWSGPVFFGLSRHAENRKGKKS